MNYNELHPCRWWHRSQRNNVNEEIDRDCIFSGRSPETLKRTTHYINLAGAKYSSRTAEKRPEIHRFTEPDLRKWHRNQWHLPFRVFMGLLWRFADSQKKACPTRPENGANLGWSVQKFYTNLLVLLIHWTLFEILQAFPAPPQNSQPWLCFWRCRLSLPRSRPRTSGTCRAHRERQSGSRRSPRLWRTESSRNSSTPPLEGLMASTLKQILKENVKGRLLDYNGWVYVKNSARIGVFPYGETWWN